MTKLTDRLANVVDGIIYFNK